MIIATESTAPGHGKSYFYQVNCFLTVNANVVDTNPYSFFELKLTNEWVAQGLEGGSE